MKNPALRWLLTGIVLFTAAPAQAQGKDQTHDRDPLVRLINAYRSAPQLCEGQRSAPLPALACHPALSPVRVSTGIFLDQVLARAGYPVAHAQAIYLDGAADAAAAMQAIESKYCSTLLSTQFSAVGARRTGDSWLIVFAQPAPPSPLLRLADWRTTGQTILQAVNSARASPRQCGARYFAAAPPLRWNAALGEAALAHSSDMARQRYFSHQGKDGREVGARALQAGYRWRTIGENIAAGQESPEEAVAEWLGSPGHCANIMNATFTEMGAAYAINSARETARVYWTQVFGTPL